MPSALGTDMSKTWTVSVLDVQPGHRGSRAHAKARVGWDLVGAGALRKKVEAVSWRNPFFLLSPVSP